MLNLFHSSILGIQSSIKEAPTTSLVLSYLVKTRLAVDVLRSFGSLLYRWFILYLRLHSITGKKPKWICIEGSHKKINVLWSYFFKLTSVTKLDKILTGFAVRNDFNKTLGRKGSRLIFHDSFFSFHFLPCVVL